MTTPAQSLIRLLAEHPCEVNMMTSAERFGFACGWLVRDGHPLNIENFQHAREWSQHWEDHMVPQDLITKKLVRAMSLLDEEDDS